jgi:hypothetical protein
MKLKEELIRQFAPESNILNDKDKMWGMISIPGTNHGSTTR